MSDELKEFARKHMPAVQAASEIMQLPATEAPPLAPEVAPKQEPHRKICVALLSYDSKMYCRTFMFLCQAIMRCAEKGWGFTYLLREGDSMVARGRSLLASQFLCNEGAKDCTDLVFIDGDVYGDGDEFMRLLSHDVDVVAGAYPFKNDGGNFPLRWPSNGLYEHNGLWIVQAVTPGFMRIRRGALERMVTEMPWLEVHDHDNGPGHKTWMFFDNLARPNGVYDEGYIFCERWRGVGGTVYVDPTITLSHIGQRIYKHGNLVDWMDRTQKRCIKILEKYPNISRHKAFQAAIGAKIDLEKEQEEAIKAGAPVTDISELLPDGAAQS